MKNIDPKDQQPSKEDLDKRLRISKTFYDDQGRLDFKTNQPINQKKATQLDNQAQQKSFDLENTNNNDTKITHYVGSENKLDHLLSGESQFKAKLEQELDTVESSNETKVVDVPKKTKFFSFKKNKKEVLTTNPTTNETSNDTEKKLISVSALQKEIAKKLVGKTEVATDLPVKKINYLIGNDFSADQLSNLKSKQNQVKQLRNYLDQAPSDRETLSVSDQDQFISGSLIDFNNEYRTHKQKTNQQVKPKTKSQSLDDQIHYSIGADANVAKLTSWKPNGSIETENQLKKYLDQAPSDRETLSVSDQDQFISGSLITTNEQRLAHSLKNQNNWAAEDLKKPFVNQEGRIELNRRCKASDYLVFDPNLVATEQKLTAVETEQLNQKLVNQKKHFIPIGETVSQEKLNTPFSYYHKDKPTDSFIKTASPKVKRLLFLQKFSIYDRFKVLAVFLGIFFTVLFFSLHYLSFEQLLVYLIIGIIFLVFTVFIMGYFIIDRIL
ncbi:hypothetical protein MCAV_00860 [[Mycoplasma] cavipharyngis]|uniref:hypothetical protein n=1 Tax=[Mycoplasma] cavipharyngis TaxID=92757 RepID=UPI003703AB97